MYAFESVRDVHGIECARRHDGSMRISLKYNTTDSSTLPHIQPYGCVQYKTRLSEALRADKNLTKVNRKSHSALASYYM